MFFFGKKARLAGVCAQIVAQTEDAVVVVDGHHDIILYNTGAARIFGYAAHEAEGEPLDMLLPERFRLQHGLMINEFAAGQATTKPMGQRSRQIYGRRKDGGEFIASVSIFRIGNGAETCYAAIVRDISQNRKTEEELLRLAATDPLTGVFNRREFLAIAEKEALRSSRYNRPLSVLMLDLDHFKRLNDTYGHAAGDKALQKFTGLCSNALRNVDVFGRWGGEEFVTLLPETDIEGAAVIGERLRKLTSEAMIVHNEHKIGLTVSVGIAQFKSGETSVEQPLGRADSAVYDAKKAGRNRISIYRN